MIKTQVELRNAKRRLLQLQQSLAHSIENLRAKGLTESEIEDLNRELLADLSQIQQEIAWFENAKQGRPITTCSIQEIGSLLISLRLAKGLSQKHLAALLKISSAQVSKDEQQNYQGLSFERAIRILDALEANIELTLAEAVKAKDGSSSTRELTSAIQDAQQIIVQKKEQSDFQALEQKILTPTTEILVTVGMKGNLALGNNVQKAIALIEEKLLVPMHARRIFFQQKFLAIEIQYELPLGRAVLQEQLETLNGQCQSLALAQKCWAKIDLP